MGFIHEKMYLKNVPSDMTLTMSMDSEKRRFDASKKKNTTKIGKDGC